MNPMQELMQLAQAQQQQAQQEQAMLQQMMQEIALLLNPQPQAPPEGATGL